MSVRGRADPRAERRRQQDQKLLDACRAGDPGAWEDVLDRYERLVYSIPLRYGLSREEAADITQQVFIALLQGLDSVRDDERLGSWLATVARRQCWRVMDANRREIVVDELPDAASADPTEQWVRLEWLYDGLLEMDVRCRDLLIALYLSGSRFPTRRSRVGSVGRSAASAPRGRGAWSGCGRSSRSSPRGDAR